MSSFKDGQPRLYLHALVLIVCVGITWGAGIPAQARSLAEITKTKEIRFCVDSTFIPILEPGNCHEDCKIGGLEYDIMMTFVETLGSNVKPTFVVVEEFDEFFFNKEGKIVREESYTPELLASEKCDLYPLPLTKLLWRLNKFDFVILYPSHLMAVVHKSKKAEFKTVVNLCGKVVAILKDSSQHTWLQEQNTSMCAANPIQMKFVTLNESFEAVDEGRVDVTIHDAALVMPALYHQFKHSVAAFKVGPPEVLGWGFRKEDKDLQAAVQTFFDTQRATPDSTLNNIWKKYFGMTLIEFISLMTSTAVQ